MSRITNEGRDLSTRRSASRPFVAVSTIQPSSSSIHWMVSRSTSSSSITRIRSCFSTWLSLLCFDRQPDDEDRTLPFSALHGDIATVLFDDSERARQANTGSLDSALHISGPIETIEDVIEIACRNADTPIAHPHDSPGTIGIAFHVEKDVDTATLWTVLDCVGQEITEDAIQPIAIPASDESRSGRVDCDLMVSRRLPAV